MGDLNPCNMYFTPTKSAEDGKCIKTLIMINLLCLLSYPGPDEGNKNNLDEERLILLPSWRIPNILFHIFLHTLPIFP